MSRATAGQMARERLVSPPSPTVQWEGSHQIEGELRALGNGLVGIVHGCLRNHTRYDEQTRLGAPSPRRRRDGRLTSCNPGCLTAVSRRRGRRPALHSGACRWRSGG